MPDDRQQGADRELVVIWNGNRDAASVSAPLHDDVTPRSGRDWVWLGVADKGGTPRGAKVDAQAASISRRGAVQ